MKNSVALTTYNGEKFIEEQLDSIRNQTMPPDEVIIRDDGSTDETSDVVMDYIKRYNLNWDFKVNETKKGFFDNFFDAIRDCTGDVIYLADQDDIWDLKKIEEFTALYMKNNDITMIQSNLRFIDSNGNEVPTKELYHGKKKSDKPIELTIIDILRFAGSGYTMSFRKCVAVSIFSKGLEKEKNDFCFHDLLLGQVASVEGKCFLLSDVVDAHRLHSNNETQREGKSYLDGRTKEVQLNILKRRKKQCMKISEISNDNYNRNIISAYKKLTEKRIELIESKHLYVVPYLFMNKKYYASAKGIITDLMYTLGMEGLLIKLYKNI